MGCSSTFWHPLRFSHRRKRFLARAVFKLQRRGHGHLQRQITSRKDVGQPQTEKHIDIRCPWSHAMKGYKRTPDLCWFFCCQRIKVEPIRDRLDDPLHRLDLGARQSAGTQVFFTRLGQQLNVTSRKLRLKSLPNCTRRSHRHLLSQNDLQKPFQSGRLPPQGNWLALRQIRRKARIKLNQPQERGIKIGLTLQIGHHGVSFIITGSKPVAANMLDEPHI